MKCLFKNLTAINQFFLKNHVRPLLSEDGSNYISAFAEGLVDKRGVALNEPHSGSVSLWEKETQDTKKQRKKFSAALQTNGISWLCNSLLALGIAPLGILFSSAAYALAPGSVSIQLVTDPLLVVDSNRCLNNEGPRAAYVGFKITNTSGSTLTDLRVNLDGFNTGAGFSLSGGQVATQYTGTLAAGASDTVYWYIQYPCTQSLTNTLTVTVSDNNPGVVIGTGNVTTNSTISANAGGLVSSTLLGPGAVVGQIISYDVSYSFGNVQNGDRFNLQPAGNIGFDAGCFQLVTSEILSSDVPGLTVGSRDQLFYLATSSKGGSGNLVSIRYFFLYLCSGINTTARPYAAQTSGNQNVKYTGNYEDPTVATVFPAATNPFTITKTASSTTLPNGGPVTYEVTVTNTSTFNALIDRITDVLPPGVTYGGLTAQSSITAANSTSLPPVGASGTISWIGIPFTSYMIPAGGSITLRYTANLPNTPGSYTNSVTGISGQSNVGPATATVGVGQNNANIILVKRITALNSTSYTDLIDGVDDINLPNYVPAPFDADDNHPNWPANYLQGRLNGGTVLPGDELEYTIYFLSTGDTTAPNVLMCDRLPQNTTFIPTTFNSIDPGADKGILLSYDSNSLALTGIQDTDNGQYFPIGIEPTDVYPNINCGGSNTNGAIVVNLGNVPNSTSSGNPTNSYGLIRFRVRVN